MLHAQTRKICRGHTSCTQQLHPLGSLSAAGRQHYKPSRFQPLFGSHLQWRRTCHPLEQLPAQTKAVGAPAAGVNHILPAAALPPEQQPGPRQQGEVTSAGVLADTRLAAAAAGSREASRVLRALCHYGAVDLSDGPASLAKVRPYNADEVQQALQHAQPLLPRLSLQQLCNLACALAAAGHLDSSFMQQLGDAAAARLQRAPRVTQHVQGLRAFRVVSWLAVAFARLGSVHAALLEQVALYATHLLLRCPLKFSKRRHGQQLALLAAAYASLRLYPPQLFRALGQHIKQHRQAVRLLGPRDSVLLLWAFAQVQHKDPPAEFLITQRATTQVGQLTCEGLTQAYSRCADTGITAAPLLAALRKASRVKLLSMQPADLTRLLVALAALCQQDLLFLDEISKAVYNKLANFTAAEVSTTLTALAALRYRNPWLLDHFARILVSRKLHRAAQLTPEQLAAVLLSCQQLGCINPLLLGHLGAVAAGRHLHACNAAQLAAVTQGFWALRFSLPQVLQAAAVRLLQLVAASHSADVSTATQQEHLQYASASADAATAAVDARSQQPQQQHQGQDSSHKQQVDHHHHQQPQQQQQQQRRLKGLMQQQEGLSQLISAAFYLAAMPPAGGTSAEKAVLPAALVGIAAKAVGLSRQLQPQPPAAGPLTAALGANSSNSSGQQASKSGSRACSTEDLIALQIALVLCSSTASGLLDAAVHATGQQQQQQQQQAQAPRSQLQLPTVLQELAALQQDVHSHLCAALAAPTDDQQHMPVPDGLLQVMQLLWLIERVQAGTPSSTATTSAVAAAAARGAGAGFTAGTSEGTRAAQEEHTRLQQGAWRLGLPRAFVDNAVQQQRVELVQQQESQGGRPLLQAVAAAIGRQLPALTAGQQQQQVVQVLHRLPDTPVVLPIAVLLTSSTFNTAAALQEGRGVVSRHQEQLNQMADLASQHELAPALWHVQTPLGVRQLKLSSVEPILTACRHMNQPLAVFVLQSVSSCQAPAQGAGVVWPTWFTSSAQQLLPAAQAWVQGLRAAGWGVLLLEDGDSQAEDE